MTVELRVIGKKPALRKAITRLARAFGDDLRFVSVRPRERGFPTDPQGDYVGRLELRQPGDA